MAEDGDTTFVAFTHLLDEVFHASDEPVDGLATRRCQKLEVLGVVGIPARSAERVEDLSPRSHLPLSKIPLHNTRVGLGVHTRKLGELPCPSQRAGVRGDVSPGVEYGLDGSRFRFKRF